MRRHVNAALRSTIAVLVFFTLAGLHGRGDGGKKSKKSKKKGKGSRPAQDPPVSKVLDRTKKDLEENGAPSQSSDTTPKETDKPGKTKENPPKREPKFKTNKDAVDHAWDDHKKGSQYDQDGKDQNIWHDTKMTRERLEALLAEAQEKGVDRPRNPLDPRSGKYVDYDTYDTNNPTGRNGQTGIRVVMDGNGNMLTAFPWPHEVVQ